MADLGPAVIGLVGVGVGSAFSVLGTYLGVRANANAARDQRENDDRRARDAYQVETLYELQMALQRVVRALGAIVHADRMRHRRTGEPWGRGLIPEPWNEEERRAAVVARLLVARVIDDEVRLRVSEVLDVANLGVIAVRSEHDADRVIQNLSDAYSSAQERISEVLRELPAPASYRPIVTAPYIDEPPDGDTPVRNEGQD